MGAMFELQVSEDKSRHSLLTSLFVKLKNEVRACRGVIVCDILGDRSRLCLAVPQKAEDYFKSLLFDVLSDIIVVEYKFEHLSSHISIPFGEETTKNAFLMALTVFDKSTDIEFVKSRLQLTDEINVDSFVNFRLTELKERWNEIADLLNENIGQLSIEGGLIEMLKFLIRTTPVECGEVLVSFDDSGKVLFSNTSGDVIYESASEETSAVSKLVALLPSRIVVCSEKQVPFTDSISNIFGEKVRIVASQSIKSK